MSCVSFKLLPQSDLNLVQVSGSSTLDRGTVVIAGIPGL